MKQRIPTELLTTNSPKEQVWCTIGVGVGLLTKNYLIDGKLFCSNYSYGMILLRCLRQLYPERNFQYDLQRTSSTITFETAKKNSCNEIAAAVLLLLNAPVNIKEDTFHAAKEYVKLSYAAQYKKASFRARLKAYEFSDLNKQIRLSDINRDIDTISYSEFQQIGRSLLCPQNICISLCGDITPDALSSLDDRLKDLLSKEWSDSVSLATTKFDPLLRQDAHILELANENVAFSVFALDFLNVNTSPLCRQLIADLLSSAFIKQPHEVYADAYDTSITVTDNMLQLRKDVFQMMDEASFDEARKAVSTSHTLILLKQPEQFSQDMAITHFCGFRLTDYMSFVPKCSYSMFLETYQKADVKLSLGQVVLRRGGRK